MAPNTTSTEPRTDLPEVEAPDSPPPIRERLETPEWLRTRISRGLALSVAVSWYVLFLVGVSLEPEAARPEALPAWISVTFSIVFIGLVALTTAGLLVRRRWGLVASMGAAALFLAGSIACPVSGHHGYEAWWYGQMACAIGLVAITAAALRRS